MRNRGALFQEKSYLPRIFRSSSLNLHAIHLINIVFWWQISFHKHVKSTPNKRQDHHGLVVDVVIMTSQSRCKSTLIQSHVAKHDNLMPVTPLIGSGTGCNVDAMAAVWQNHIGKKLKLYSNWGHPYTIISSTCSWRHKDTRLLRFFLK